VPFASRAPGGLSRVSMRWVKLGIVAERSRPASPQDNGRHERMHSTLQQATLAPPERNPRRQQAAFDRFQHQFNYERPHEALQDRTPASCYEASPRQMPRRTPELEYGDDVVVRRISQQGSLKWNGERTFVSEIFAYEWMGLRALDERYYEVLYGPVTVGFLDTFQHVFHRALPLALRRRLGIEPHHEHGEMPAAGKPGNPTPGFPLFPPSLEIAARFPHSHIHHDSSYNP
jgi:putative transposase